MKRRTAVVLVGSLVVVSALVVMAKQESAPQNLTPQTVRSDQKVAVDPPLTPMTKEIQTVFDAEKEALAVLETRLKSASTEVEVMGLMKEIERVKVETELKILGVQAVYARKEGRIEQAEKLESEIRRMRAGQPHAAQQPRLDPNSAPTVQ
jgi:hypothetical protein